MINRDLKSPILNICSFKGLYKRYICELKPKFFNYKHEYLTSGKIKHLHTAKKNINGSLNGVAVDDIICEGFSASFQITFMLSDLCTNISKQESLSKMKEIVLKRLCG